MREEKRSRSEADIRKCLKFPLERVTRRKDAQNSKKTKKRDDETRNIFEALGYRCVAPERNRTRAEEARGETNNANLRRPRASQT